MRYLPAIVLLLLISPIASGGEPTLADLRAEFDALRKEFNASEHEQSDTQREIDGRVNRALCESLEVSTTHSHLQIGGLLQVWAYSIQHDSQGLLNVPAVVPADEGKPATDNHTASTDSFRVRRAELRFELDISPNISAYVSIDPAREATSFPSFPSNQGTGIPGDSDAIFFATCDCLGQTDPRGLGSPDGAGQALSFNRLLQDAYITYHDFVPHHDFRGGQMRRMLGEEGSRDDSELDFVERSMITQLADIRDLGLQAHGRWLDDRLQYWLGVFDDAGTAFQQRSNRADENNDKDFAATVIYRPLWSECHGHLEFGYSILNGTGGETNVVDPSNFPINGLNRHETVHQLQYAWASCKLPGPARGWWVRGEWGQYRDRFAPGEVTTGNAVMTTNPQPFSSQGWYFATGYKISESPLADKLPSDFRKLEFLFRYDVMQNIFFHSLVVPESQLDLFKTDVYTAGVNYFVSEQNVKLQLNYNFVGEPSRKYNSDDRQFRSVRNDNIVLSLQVLF